jgi:hypothetical protein
LLANSHAGANLDAIDTFRRPRQQATIKSHPLFSGSGYNLLDGLCNRVIAFISMSEVIGVERLCLRFLLQKHPVFIPGHDNLPGFDVVDQAWVRIYPFRLPLIPANVLEDTNPLERNAWLTLLSDRIFSSRFDFGPEHCCIGHACLKILATRKGSNSARAPD